MDASHTEGVDHILVARFLHAVVPIHLDGLAVLFPTVRPGQTAILEGEVVYPLVHVVAPHLLAVAAAEHHAVLLGQLGVLLVVPECLGTGVHGRPQDVRLHAEHQLKHFLVGARTDVVHLLVEVLGRPRLQAPVLVVDEDAPELDRGRTIKRLAPLHIYRGVLARCHVCPPVPGRHAHHARQLHQSVGGATRVAAEYGKCVGIHHGNAERFPFPFHLGGFYLALGGKRVDGCRPAQCPDNKVSLAGHGCICHLRQDIAY